MIIVAIAGGTGSGKTTLANNLISHYNKIKTEYICLDSYYKDHSNMSLKERSKINFDHPDSIDFDLFYQQIIKYKNGNSIKIPSYSYKRHKRLKKKINVKHADLLIIEGILILLKKNIRDFFDLSIFLNVGSDLRLKRRIKRDAIERARNENNIKERFNKMIKPMHKKYVESYCKFADIVLDENYDLKIIKDKIDYLLDGNYK